MSKYTFKQLQAEYPNDAACLAKLMEINYGGTEITCPGCGVERAKFHPMTKRRAYACQECGHRAGRSLVSEGLGVFVPEATGAAMAVTK
jgi:DNA-directed RNA polymerase subunit RPC12/RpoP